MKKIFWENPYQTELETKVTEIEGNKILFNKTIAYSFAGGQESDKAWINGLPILNSMRVNNLIYYIVVEDHPFKVGDLVTMTIDWARRYRLMRLHFAAELILEIVTQNYKLEKIGAHISESKARIDFKTDINIASLFEEVLQIYNEIIRKDLQIEKGYSDLENQRRYWKIEGFAKVPCGGTHVNSTKEVGYVTLKRDNRGKSIERIEIHLIEDSI